MGFTTWLGGILGNACLAQGWRATKNPFESLTIGNARAFGLDREIGTIEAGKRADLLILTSSPLENVMAYDTIDRVILGGEVIMRKSLSAGEWDH